MKNLDFQYIRAKNFLCFGPEGIEIDLKSYGNIILVRGKNKDILDDEGHASSNGVGKSSIPEILVYALYGKTIKKLTNDKIINLTICKDLEVEIIWDNYRIVRSRKPNKLKLWESKDHIWDENNEKTRGSMTDTQKAIQDIIGLSYETFVNTVIFRDNNSGCFLESDTPTKRQIIDNLLSLGSYREYSDKAKKIKSKYKEKIKLISEQYSSFLSQLNSCETRIEKIKQQEEEWKNNKEEELAELINLIKTKTISLRNSNSGAALIKYNEAQEELKELEEKMSLRQSEIEQINKIKETVQGQLDEELAKKYELDSALNKAQSNMADFSSTIRKNEKTISDYENKKGKKCPTCLGIVKKENYEHLTIESEKIIDKEKEKLEAQKLIAKEKSALLETINLKTKKLNEAVELASKKSLNNSKIITSITFNMSRLSKVNKPDADADDKILNNDIESLKKQAIVKKKEIDGLSPYKEIKLLSIKEKEDKENECKDKKTELEKTEQDLPYYNFWVNAFGDNGIRKFIIDGIIPALNSRITYWLQFLIDGKIKLEFDNEFNEIISRVPSKSESFVYHNLSGGERRRLNLAVSQAFAHIMTIDSGAASSILFLDEVTTNIDPLGVENVYNMIMQLSKNKKVFVTTHDRDLLEALGDCDSINLERKNEFTTLV